MKLKSLSLENFRCFDRLDVTLEPDLTVLVGVNGSGKSAILDGISYGLSRPIGITPGFDPQTLPQIGIDDVRLFKGAERQRSSKLSLSTTENIDWSIAISTGKPKEPQLDENQLATYWTKIIRDIQNDQIAAVLPVFAYYSVSRSSGELPERKRNFRDNFSRFDALTNCLEPTSHFKDWFEWFEAHERDELERFKEWYALPQTREYFKNHMPDFGCYPKMEFNQNLDAVRNAITQMLDGVSEPKIKSSPLRMVVTKRISDGNFVEIPINMLSDGYRSMLALVMDFARRMVQANPKSGNPLEAEAIMLLDEVELHLHPQWQQTVLPSLQRTFPNTQFIVTTHSPQVLTTVDSRNIRILRDNRLFAAPDGPSGAESKRMLETVLGVGSRPPENERVKQLERLFAAISEDKLDDAKQLAGELIAEFRGSEPALDEAITMIDNRIWEKEVNL